MGSVVLWPTEAYKSLRWETTFPSRRLAAKGLFQAAHEKSKVQSANRWKIQEAGQGKTKQRLVVCKTEGIQISRGWPGKWRCWVSERRLVQRRTGDLCPAAFSQRLVNGAMWIPLLLELPPGRPVDVQGSPSQEAGRVPLSKCRIPPEFIGASWLEADYASEGQAGPSRKSKNQLAFK